MDIMRTSAFIFLVLLASGCSLKPPPPGLDLTDGCYYIDDLPVLRISGQNGRFLVPGDVGTVHVNHDNDGNIARAIFLPGFLFDKKPTLAVRRQSQFPIYYMMMKPFTLQPVVMVPTDSLGFIDLERGKPC